MRQEKERNALEDKYNNAFQRREQVVHHIAWAKQRGEAVRTIKKQNDKHQSNPTQYNIGRSRANEKKVSPD